MAPKKNKSPQSDPNGIFLQMTVFMIETGEKSRRVQVWKQKLVQMGAEIEDRFSRRVTHIFATDLNSLSQKIDRESLTRFQGKVLNYQWLEDSLRKGEKVPSDSYTLSTDTRGGYGSNISEDNHVEITNRSHSSINNSSQKKKLKTSPEETDTVRSKAGDKISEKFLNYPSKPDTSSGLSHFSCFVSPEVTTANSQNRAVTTSTATSLYSPPDLNRNITEIFRKLIDIYRALGDDRRSFSYYKAIPVIEKLSFKIESADQVKNQPGIGKSLQDHEIVNTGKLSKLEHFEKDEKVSTISLFGEVWGIGPATATKLYEKGHRTLDDLKDEESLTNSQRLGLQYLMTSRQGFPAMRFKRWKIFYRKLAKRFCLGQ